MKHLVAIFSVILTLGGIVSTDVYGESKCRLHPCKIDEDKEELLSKFGQTGNNPYNKLSKSEDLSGELCFHCDAINDDDDCDHNAVVATFDTDNNPFVFYCRSDGWAVDDDWELMPIGNLQECSDSPLWKTAKGKPGVKPNPRLRYKSGDDWVDVTESMHLYDGSGQADGSKVCTIWECESTYTPAADGKSCVVGNSETACTNSHGQWDATNSKCLCGSDRTDGKGAGQIYDAPGVRCKCESAASSWNPELGGCVDPWAECTDSGGTPNGTVCDCTAVEPDKTVSPDGKKCVANDKYPKCRDSGGTWSGGRCQCDSGKGLAGPNSNDECYCKDTGKIYNGTQCVTSPEAWCTGTGGEWNDASETCNCDIAAKNIMEVPDSSPTRCECVDSDYVFESDKTKGCKLTDAAKRRNDAFNELKNLCEEYWVGSTWFPADATSADARDRGKWKCECDASHGFVSTPDGLSCKCDEAKGFILDSVTPPYKCRMTAYDQDKLNCEAAIAAGAAVTWKDNGVVHGRNTGYCKCNNPNKMYNHHTKQCLDGTTAATVCSMIEGAAMSRDGRCLCLATEREPINYQCPVTGGHQSHGGAGDTNTGAFQAQANQKKQQVYDISKKLKEISDSFGRSHWKNSDGKFNTARLASDSIAGVVLGTVGGVVTSNIIKKNQVRGGFESINCNVGGQKVADYGDQFQVGIR